MHQCRQALLRMWQGDSDRQIAAAQVVGRPKAAQLRELAQQHGWLAPEQPLPEDGAIAAALKLQFEAVSHLDEHEREAVQTMIAGVLHMHDSRRWQQPAISPGTPRTPAPAVAKKARTKRQPAP